jgi:hypothetical protein
MRFLGDRSCLGDWSPPELVLIWVTDLSARYSPIGDWSLLKPSAFVLPLPDFCLRIMVTSLAIGTVLHHVPMRTCFWGSDQVAVQKVKLGWL